MHQPQVGAFFNGGLSGGDENRATRPQAGEKQSGGLFASPRVESHRIRHQAVSLGLCCRSGCRVPKAALLENMVKALNVSRECLLEENGITVAMLEQLFWLDEEMPDIIKLAKTCRSSAGCNTHSAFPCSMTITTIGPHARLSPCGLTLQFWMMFCAIGPRCRGHCGMGNCQESSILSGRSGDRRKLKETIYLG